MSTTTPVPTLIDSVATVEESMVSTVATKNETVLSKGDKKIIDETIGEIIDIFEDSAISTHERVGELILEKIFNRDFASAREINDPKSNSPKAVLFRHLEGEFEARSGEAKLPKKTWLYNAVNIALDKWQIEELGEGELYKSLNVSLKIELLQAKTVEEKKDLIDKIIAEKLSVRDVRKLFHSKPNSKVPGLLTYIKDPTQIVDVKEIKLVGGKKKEAAIKLANDTIQTLTEEIERKQSGLKKLRDLLDELKKCDPKKGRRKK